MTEQLIYVDLYHGPGEGPLLGPKPPNLDQVYVFQVKSDAACRKSALCARAYLSSEDGSICFVLFRACEHGLKILLNHAEWPIVCGTAMGCVCGWVNKQRGRNAMLN